MGVAASITMGLGKSGRFLRVCICCLGHSRIAATSAVPTMSSISINPGPLVGGLVGAP